MRMVIAAVFLVIALSLNAQEAEITFKSTEISSGIFMVEGVGGFGGGNMAILVGEDLVAMVDDGIPPLAPTLVAHVDETIGRPIDMLVNTHVHSDHTGANALFAEDGTMVFAHDNIRKRLLEKTEDAGGPAGLPVVTFADGVTFHIGDVEARIKHVPHAHTDGDSVVHFPQANVIHAGDVLFHPLFPYIDLDSGGSVSGYIAAQKVILSMADDETQIIPGHGTLTNKAGMQKTHNMIVEGYAAVKSMVDKGASEDDIVAANLLEDYAAEYNWNFISGERLVRTFYRDLTAGK